MHFMGSSAVRIGAVFFVASLGVQAQTVEPKASPTADNPTNSGRIHRGQPPEPSSHGGVAEDAKKTFGDFVSAQKRIWTSPARLKISDADWLVPTAGIA